MLFTKQDINDYRLWSSKYCLYILIVSFSLFTFLIILSLKIIQFSPSHLGELKINENGLYKLELKISSNKYTIINNSRVVFKDGHSQNYPIRQFENEIYIETTDSLDDCRAVFGIAKQRSLWNYVWSSTFTERVNK